MAAIAQPPTEFRRLLARRDPVPGRPRARTTTAPGSSRARPEYERLLKEPMEAMIVALAERLEARGVPMRADPKRSPFRIYRDTRFSKDKSPYKTHLGASFPWLGRRGAGGEMGGSHDERAHGNGGYFHFQPGEMYVGGGHVADGEADGSTRSGRRSATSRSGCGPRSRTRRSSTWFGRGTAARRAEALPARLPAGSPDGPGCSSGRTWSSGGGCPTTRCCRRTCPTGSPRATPRPRPSSGSCRAS